MNTFFKLIQSSYMILCFVLVSNPNAIEASALYKPEGAPEIISSLPMKKPIGEDQLLNGSSIAGMFNVVDETSENFSKLGTRFDKTGVTLSSRGKPMRNNPSQASSNKSEEPQILASDGKSEYFHAILFNIFTWIILPLLYAAGHNY